MIVAVDFDNTIIEPVKYPDTSYKLKENCKEVLNRLNKKGYIYSILTQLDMGGTSGVLLDLLRKINCL